MTPAGGDPGTETAPGRDVPLPPGWGLTWSPRVRSRGPALLGGTPRRVLRLTPAGVAAASRLRGDVVAGRADGLLARRLVDAGLAWPRPARDAPVAGVTVVVPVHERAAELDRCLAALSRAHPVVVVDDGSTGSAAVAAVADRHGARLVRRSRRGGPAAARTTGLEHVGTDLVAFLDSDCAPPEGWPGEELLRHLADPALAAVGPRVVATSPRGAVGAAARYGAAASPLDMGADPAEVRRDGRTRYLPTAALVLRRAALGTGFDARLRHGEDVDLVWRVLAAGWRVRYEPASVVHHHEPVTWRGLLGRRYRYGTSAGPLARRHPGDLAPLVLQPVPAAVVGLLLAGRRPAVAAAAAVAVWGTARTGLRLHRAGLPARGAVPLVAGAVLSTAAGLGRWLGQLAPLPTAAAALLRPRSAAGRVAALVVAVPLAEWLRDAPGVGPLRWVVARLADDAAYGAGVLRGAVRERTPGAVLPHVPGLAEAVAGLRRRLAPRRTDAPTGSLRTR